MICPGSMNSWQGAGKFNTRNAPWTLREELGFGGYRMRGYYASRYIDNNLMAAQVELRQHVWWRLGLAAWGGAGVTFPRFDALQWSDVLPPGAWGCASSSSTASTCAWTTASGATRAASCSKCPRRSEWHRACKSSKTQNRAFPRSC